MSYLLIKRKPKYVTKRRKICYSNVCGNLKGTIVKRCGICNCPIKALTIEESFSCRADEKFWDKENDNGTK